MPISRCLFSSLFSLSFFARLHDNFGPTDLVEQTWRMPRMAYT
jgi:hypothetical protein